jgi:hypothetical protein
MIPTIGRIVHYRMSKENAEAINRRRAHTRSHIDAHRSNANGVQVHVGNDVSEGDAFPLMITRVWGNQPDCYVNGQVMLDGNDLFWATSVKVGEGPGTYSWPTRA